MLALPAAAIAAVLFLLLPSAWGGRIWAALTTFLAAWHLSGKTNDTGQALATGWLSGWFALIAIGIVLGGLAGVAMRAAKPSGSAAPRASNLGSASPRALAVGSGVLAFVAVLPLGCFFLAAASLVLAGNAHPVAWHVGLLIGTACLGALAFLRKPLVQRGLMLGMAATCAWALVDSLRLEAVLLANMDDWYNQPGMPKCLGTGPAGRPLTDQRPLMALTVERPLMLRVDDEPGLGPQYWSFRDRSFVATNPPPPTPTCEPSTEPLLPG